MRSTKAESTRQEHLRLLYVGLKKDKKKVAVNLLALVKTKRKTRRPHKRQIKPFLYREQNAEATFRGTPYVPAPD